MHMADALYCFRQKYVSFFLFITNQNHISPRPGKYGITALFAGHFYLYLSSKKGFKLLEIRTPGEASFCESNMVSYNQILPNGLEDKPCSKCNCHLHILTVNPARKEFTATTVNRC